MNHFISTTKSTTVVFAPNIETTAAMHTPTPNVATANNVNNKHTLPAATDTFTAEVSVPSDINCWRRHSTHLDQYNTSESTELTLTRKNSTEIVSHLNSTPAFETYSDTESSEYAARESPSCSVGSLECFEVDPNISVSDDNEQMIAKHSDHQSLSVNTMENKANTDDKVINKNLSLTNQHQVKSIGVKTEATTLNNTNDPPIANLCSSSSSPSLSSSNTTVPALPVELQYLGKKKNSIKRDAIMGMKEQLAEDDYLRKLCTELQFLQYNRSLTTAERYRRVRAKQNEILYYRNQDMVAEYYNGRVVKNNGSDFILLPGKTIPKNLPDGFTFGLRGSADETGKRDVLLIQKIKEVHGL